MKTKHVFTLAVAVIMAISLMTTAWAKPPKMKMTTKIPPGIAAPDTVETRFGTLHFEDGFPTEETAQKVYDQLDFQRAVEGVLMATPGAFLATQAVAIRPQGRCLNE